MSGSAIRPQIQLHDLMIGFPLPLPKLLCHPSRLALKFSVNGVGEEVLSTRGDTDDGIWEVKGDVKVCEDQLLTATILICVENSTKELSAVTVNYSQLLAHAEARSKECYEIIVDGSASSVLILVTCFIRTLMPPPRKQRIFTEPVPSPGKSKSDEGRIGSNRASTPDASSSPSITDLERYYGQAVSLPAGRKSQALYAIGRAYCGTYETTYEMRHLERAISILGEALQNAGFHPKLPTYLIDYVTCLLKRFERTGSLDDVEHAVSKSQDAVYLVETNDPDRHRYISHHAVALLRRFQCLGKIEDLENSISFMDQAVGLVPDGHPDKLGYLNNLGGTLKIRFDRLGHIEDLEIAITHWQKAVDLTPDGQLHKAGFLNNLGISFEERFNQLGRIDDLETAIVHKLKAVDLTPDGQPHKPGFLKNLGTSFRERFNQLGHINDLETAIAYQQKAVDLTPDGHPDKPGHLNNLGNTFQTRFDRLGHVGDLEMAIAHRQKAVDLTPDSHPDKSGYINNLGNSFEKRFDWLGHVEDLEMAVVHKQKAVDLTPDGHSDKLTRINNLGNAFEKRFGRLGRVEDQETAITHWQKAVDRTPDDHPHKRAYLNNLGNAFGKRFEGSGRVKDQEMAIVYSQKAVDLTPDDHPSKPAYLDNLGCAFGRGFDRLGRVKDQEMAIMYLQKAVDLTPDGHPDKPGRLNNLGHVIETRFDRLGHEEDLEIAIMHKQKAVDLTPDAHPGKASHLERLGAAFISRFKLFQRLEDVRVAALHFSKAALLPTASPRVRLNCARLWGRTSELMDILGATIPSLLEPWNLAIDLLPRVAWLGIPMSTQHTLLEQVGVTVREAVTAAIKVEEYETAVEWAEAGRSIAWQNLLHLRTPVSELRSVHYDLADRLEKISRQLDMSVRGGDGQINGPIDEMEGDSRSHVQLALDWDKIVADIRSKPGFESFLKPKSFNELGRIACDGPVVILNITNDRCDALILIPEDNGGVYISNISLGGFSYAKGEALLKKLKGLLSSKHLRARDCRKPRRMPIDDGTGPPLEDILRCLWLDVVKPIIDALAYQPRSEDLPHIWWCATGPLAFLPIHAAGLYNMDELGSKLSDYVVSSYTPTLSALLDDSPPIQDFRLLAIAQANAPGASSIPATEVELEKIQTLSKNINVTTMTREEATVERVWHGMENSNWVHLACHGQQNIKEPMKSGLLLHDGTLELQRLIEKPLPRADFAFLSACQTATGDESVAEESLHLAAGMLFAGYKGVIGTMWSIMDDVGPRVAEDVYREMLKDGKPNRKAAAHALHEAVRRLREDPKVDMLHWVPFIHIGV